MMNKLLWDTSPDGKKLYNKILEWINYDELTGMFEWKIKRPGSKGKFCGSVTKAGYIEIGLLGRRFLAHRLAWFIIHKEWPYLVDHKNGNKKDNRIKNLRSCCHRQNSANRHTKFKRKHKLPTGVYLQSDKKSYMSRIFIRKEKRYIHIGTFKTASEASIAYKEKHKEIFKEFSNVP